MRNFVMANTRVAYTGSTSVLGGGHSPLIRRGLRHIGELVRDGDAMNTVAELRLSWRELNQLGALILFWRRAAP